DMDVIFRHTQSCGNGTTYELWCLYRCIEFCLAFCYMGERIDWLHGVVCEVRSSVGPLQHFGGGPECRFGVAITSQHLRLAPRGLCHPGAMRGCALEALRDDDFLLTTPRLNFECAFVEQLPLDFNSLLGIYYFPGGISNDDDHLRKADGVESILFVVVG